MKRLLAASAFALAVALAPVPALAETTWGAGLEAPLASVDVSSMAMTQSFGATLYAQGTLSGLDPNQSYYVFFHGTGFARVQCNPSGVYFDNTSIDENSNSLTLSPGTNNFSTQTQPQTISPSSIGCPSGDTSTTILSTPAVYWTGASLQVMDTSTLTVVLSATYSYVNGAWTRTG